MNNLKPATGEHLDNIGELWRMKRKILKVIPLFLGWKLVKEEKDKDFRKRILKQYERRIQRWKEFK